MEKNCCMKFYVSVEKKRGKKASEIEKALKEVCEDVPSSATIYRWFKDKENTIEFREETRGRPNVLRSAAMIDDVKWIIDMNPNASLRAIAEEIGIGKDTVRSILREDLGMRKVCSTWIPHNLDEKTKALRVGCAKAIKKKICQLGSNATQYYACEDETWVFFDSHGTKQENKVWLKKDSKRPRLVKPRLTARKALLLIAFTCDKKISVEAKFNEKVDSNSYIKFVKNTGDKWRTLRNRPAKLSKVVWQHDNARPHVSAATKDFFSKRGVELLWQAPYSPDLNLLDRWVNKELKNELRKCNYDSAEEVQKNALQAMRAIPQSRYIDAVSYTHLRAHETRHDLVCRLLLEKKKK